MIDGFDISVVVEHGCPHYKIVDMDTGNEIHCDTNELNKTIDELLQDDCNSHKESDYYC